MRLQAATSIGPLAASDVHENRQQRVRRQLHRSRGLCEHYLLFRDQHHCREWYGARADPPNFGNNFVPAARVRPYFSDNVAAVGKPRADGVSTRVLAGNELIGPTLTLLDSIFIPAFAIVPKRYNCSAKA